MSESELSSWPSALWPERLADDVAARLPVDERGRLVCASGISPSGPIHMGNLREVFTTHFVANALRARGHDVVHLHSWDDYDRLRKVPAGVDEDFGRYVGMPLAEVPDPSGGAGSYAERFMDEFREALHVLGVEMDEVRQSQRYPEGTYNAAIRRAMDEREPIFDTLAAQQTDGRHETSLDERRRAYYPFKPYCEDCRRDTTRVRSYADETVGYDCACGHEGTMSLADGQTISGKLVWKVDWPMRWAHEGVAFEPAGEDHHAPTGSYTVGRQLVRDVYGGEAPASVVYSFVRLAGVGGKMSSSAGQAAVPADALEVLEPAIVRWLYLRRQPAQSFAIDLSPKGVQRLYDEWDQLCARAQQPEVDPVDSSIYAASVQAPTGEVQRTPRPVSFRLLASVADITQGNREQIARIVSQHLDEPLHDLDELQPRLDCAVHYATHVVPPEQRTTIRDTFAEDHWRDLDPATQESVRTLSEQMGDEWTLDGLTRLVYAMPKRQLGLPLDAGPSPELKVAQRSFFKVLYRLLCDAETGPRLPTLLLSIGPERARLLLGSGAFTKS